MAKGPTYISYSPHEETAALEISRQLQSLDDSLVIDIGDVWSVDEDVARLRGATSCLVLVGRDGLSPIQRSHLAILEEERRAGRGLLIVPVLLPRGERGRRTDYPPSFDALKWIEFKATIKDRAVIESIDEALDSDGLDVAVGQWSRGGEPIRCPYMGLQAFGVGDSEWFFGREAVVEWTISDMRRRLASAASGRFLAIVGPSGTGKSSLAQAGILASIWDGLLEGGGRPWKIMSLKPGPDPLLSLARALAEGGAGASATSLASLVTELRGDDQALHHILKRVSRSQRPLIFIDQFEEVFTLARDSGDAKAFIDNVVTAARHPSGVAFFLVTLRSDFYGSCAKHDELAMLLSDSQVLIGAMTTPELRRAIEKPAVKEGYRFEPGLIERLVADVQGRSAALPLLQFALVQLWLVAESGVLTEASYEQIGGVGGALAHHADLLFNGLTPSDQTLCRRILLRLVQPGDRSEDTRRRIALEELRFEDRPLTEVRGLLEKLAGEQGRLIAISTMDKQVIIEISHEALLSEWPRFREWINVERESMIFHRLLSSSVAQWIWSERDEGLLLRGSLLQRADEWYADHSVDANIDEVQFLFESAKARMRELLLCDPLELRANISATRSLKVVRAMELTDLVSWSGHDDRLMRRIRLAFPDLFGHDASDLLYESLTVLEPVEFELTCAVLQEIRPSILYDLWRDVGDGRIPPAARLGCYFALALLDPRAGSWESHAHECVDLLIAEDMLTITPWLGILVRVSSRLEDALLERASSSGGNRGPARRRARDLALHLCSGSARAVPRLLCEEESLSEAVVGPLLAEMDGHPDRYRTELLTIAVNSARPRAAGHAAAVLLRLGFADAAIERLCEYGMDERTSHFARTGRHHTVLLDALAERVFSEERPVVRMPLLLAMGEYRPLPPLRLAAQRRLIEKLLDLFGGDENSGIHAAIGWLLRTWSCVEEVAAAERDLVTARPVPGRQWWVADATGDPLTLVRIAAGSFLMGSPPTEAGRSVQEARHPVSLATPYYVADRVIRRSEYERLALEGGFRPYSENLDEWSPSGRHPVVSQTWTEAVWLCRSLTERAGGSERDQALTIADDPEGESVEFFPKAGGFRLLTEAEWEYACRAGSSTAFSFGSDASLLKDFGWFLDNCPDRQTRPCRLLRPSLYGLFDMHGNVYEWCFDWYGPYSHGQSTDPRGPQGGDGRVLRGGGYNYSANDCRSAYRYFTRASNRNARIGIRIGMTALSDSGVSSPARPGEE